MAVVSGSSGDKKNLNVELNLMPVFDVLAVCICFLLMTVVWIQVGMIKTSQSLGGQSQSETKKTPSIWLTIDGSSNIELSLKDLTPELKNKTPKTTRVLKSQKGLLNFSKLNDFAKNIKGQGFDMVLLVPAANTSYESLVAIMDIFKNAGILNIGITPL